MKLIIKQTNNSNSLVLILQFTYSVGDSGDCVSHTEVRASDVINCPEFKKKKTHFINIMHNGEILGECEY